MNAAEEHAARLRDVVAREPASGHIAVHRWYLRHDTPWNIGPPEPRGALALVRAHAPSVAFYRFLYDTVGHDWLWGDMRRASDDAIAARLTEPGNRLHYLTIGGTPAGMVEVRRGDGESDLAYVGLMPGRTGEGLGRWMLRAAIAETLAERREPLTINTCTTDSAAGLALYTSLGFRVVDEVDFEERDPRADGLIERHVRPAIPLAK